MNWFNKHLNWTVVLSWLTSYFIFLALLAIFSTGIEPYVTDELAANGLVLIYSISFVLLPVFVAGWALKKKSRNLWWLLILYVPFGALFFLTLENRSEPQSIEFKEAEPEIGKQKEDYEIQTRESDKSPSYTSRFWILKTSSIVLAVALVAAIVYSIVIIRDRDALNIELKSVQYDLTLTRAELTSTKENLSSMQAQLNSIQQTLYSVQNELDAAKAELRLYEETLGVRVFSGVQQPPVTGGDLIGSPNLKNNSIATDPTWQELKEFLLIDPTDDEVYSLELFNCVSFAEMLHNNAEAAGIKAAFVAVQFTGSDIGHTLNAFRTTDKGLVYVDNTTNEQLQQIKSEEWDKIAYLATGKEYGSISLGSNTPLDYSSYEKMKADWDIYNQKLEAYDWDLLRYKLDIIGYELGNIELWQIEELESSLEAQRRELNNLLAQLESVWPTLGIVANFDIYW